MDSQISGSPNQLSHGAVAVIAIASTLLLTLSFQALGFFIWRKRKGLPMFPSRRKPDQAMILSEMNDPRDIDDEKLQQGIPMAMSPHEAYIPVGYQVFHDNSSASFWNANSRSSSPIMTNIQLAELPCDSHCSPAPSFPKPTYYSHRGTVAGAELSGD